MSSIPLNCFPVGSRVDVSDIPEYQGVTIDRISDSGVTVNGPRCSKDTVLSGASPATLAQDAPESAPESNKPDYKIPSQPFTTREFAEANGISVMTAMNWIKEHCENVGVAPKIEGQRGKAPMIFRTKTLDNNAGA